MAPIIDGNNRDTLLTNRADSAAPGAGAQYGSTSSVNGIVANVAQSSLTCPQAFRSNLLKRTFKVLFAIALPVITVVVLSILCHPGALILALAALGAFSFALSILTKCSGNQHEDEAVELPLLLPGTDPISICC